MVIQHKFNYLIWNSPFMHIYRETLSNRIRGNLLEHFLNTVNNFFFRHFAPLFLYV